MGYDLHRARMEAELSRAHRALYKARTAAEEGGIHGAAEDLHQLEREVARVAEGSLRNSRRVHVVRGQMELGS
jgi:hypothetical protein